MVWRDKCKPKRKFERNWKEKIAVSRPSLFLIYPLPQYLSGSFDSKTLVCAVVPNMDLHEDAKYRLKKKDTGSNTLNNFFFLTFDE